MCVHLCVCKDIHIYIHTVCIYIDLCIYVAKLAWDLQTEAMTSGQDPEPTRSIVDLGIIQKSLEGLEVTSSCIGVVLFGAVEGLRQSRKWFNVSSTFGCVKGWILSKRIPCNLYKRSHERLPVWSLYAYTIELMPPYGPYIEDPTCDPSIMIVYDSLL